MFITVFARPLRPTFNPIQYRPSVCAWNFKVVCLLQVFRPELRMLIFRTQDTGLRPSDYRAHCRIWQQLQTMEIRSIVIFLLISLFSKILSLCSSFNARGSVLYHMKGHKKLWFFSIYFGLLSLLITRGRRNLNWHSDRHFQNLIFTFFVNGFSWNV